MKLRKKTILTVCLILAATLLITGCSGELTPYQKNDAESFNVSVRFDANGGLFATNTAVIMDSFNISGMKTNSAGQVEIPLLAPDDAQRGREGFTVYNSGYFLAGWYAERTETGENEFTYSKKWDFSKDRLTVFASEEYSSSEPVLTLYAVWIPSFEVEYYDLDTGELLETKPFNPMTSKGIAVPQWNEKTGKIDMNDIPKRKGYTFNGVYLDQEGTQSVTSDIIEHSGIVNEENGTGSNGTMKLYVDWLEGEWYHIHTAKQFTKNADLNANYVICADLDFSDAEWPDDLMDGGFTGTIQGNGYSFMNINIDSSATNTGLFEQLLEGAKISDITFAFKTQNGKPVANTGLGLVSAQINENAELTNVQITVDGTTVYPE